MRGEQKFVRHRHGVTAFARVAVDARPDVAWAIRWELEPVAPGSCEIPRHVFGSALEWGLRVALREHEARGGAPHGLTVVSTGAVPVDTQTDAVTCAATLAAWKALGHDDAGLGVEFVEGQWRVRFRREGGVTLSAWREGHYLGLAELLRTLEGFVGGLTWQVHFEEVAPEPAAEALEALGPDVRLPTAELLERVSPSVQVIDGLFLGYRLPGAVFPDVVLRAVDSTWWDVEAEDEALLAWVRRTFPDAQDIVSQGE